MEKRSNVRNCMITQYFENKKTKEKLIDLEKIKKVLEEWDNIKNYAYIIHDKDKNEDGTLKEKHIHIALSFNNPTKIQTVSKMFEIKEEYIEKSKKKSRAFENMLLYFTHESKNEQIKGKYLYSRNEIVSNLSFEEINEGIGIVLRKEDVIDIEAKRIIYEKLTNNEITKGEIREKFRRFYIENINKIEKFERDRIENIPMPKYRINYYISGKSGYGKSYMSMMLAKALFPEIENEKDVYHIVGGEKVLFDTYRGQPVIIWEDMRSAKLVEILGGKGNVFKMFDNFPKESVENVKYGNMKIVNSVNIINGIEPYEEFLDGLVKGYDRNGELVEEEKNQSYRRFPIILELKDKTFDIYFNMGIINDTEKYKDYVAYRGYFKMTAKRLEEQLEEQKKRMLKEKMVQPILDCHQKVIDKYDLKIKEDENERIENVEELLEMIDRQNANVIVEEVKNEKYYIDKIEELYEKYRYHLKKYNDSESQINKDKYKGNMNYYLGEINKKVGEFEKKENIRMRGGEILNHIEIEEVLEKMEEYKIKKEFLF